MRAALILAAVTITISLGPAMAQGKCPASALTASYKVWAPDTLPTGRTATGTHPCGKSLTCTGGVRGQRASRVCRWN